MNNNFVPYDEILTLSPIKNFSSKIILQDKADKKFGSLRIF